MGFQVLCGLVISSRAKGVGMFDGAAVEQRRRALRYKSPQSYYHRRAIAEPECATDHQGAHLRWPGGGGLCAAQLPEPRERPNRMRQISL